MSAAAAPLVAALVAASIAYLMWRMQFTRPWLEKIPLVLDLSFAVAAASAGTAYLSSQHVPVSLGYGLFLGTAWTGLVVLDYLIAWGLAFFPTFAGIDETVDLPGLEIAQARRLLARRLVSLGYVLEGAGDEQPIAARLVGNKVAWPRKLRPKTVRIDLIGGGAGANVKARIRIRYTVPALGFTRHLRPMMEEILELAGPATQGAAAEEDADLAIRLWLPLEIIVVGLFVFAFLILWLWAVR